MQVFIAATKVEHLKQQTAKQKNPTKDNKTKQKFLKHWGVLVLIVLAGED